jgi:Ohr subfamily peroxiredoxin
MGGNGEGTNPEQLFAAGYGACFLGALGVVARTEGVKLGEHSLDVEVDLFKEEATGFHIGARLTLNAPDLDAETAEKLLHAAHQVCPYSKATRGNIEVDLKVA